MLNIMDYKPVKMNREQTEAKIKQINKQIEILGNVPDEVISYTDVREIMVNLQSLKRQLHRDLKYWDACDRAIEEAVK